MKITYGLARPQTWKPISALIMFLGGTNSSHSYSILPDGRVYQATLDTGNGHVHYNSAEDLDAEYTRVEEFEFEFNESQGANLMAYVDKQLGVPYGNLELFGFALMNLVYWLTFRKIKIKNPFSDGERTHICIELQIRMIMAAMKDEPSFGPPKDPESMEIPEFKAWMLSLPFLKEHRVF